MRGETLRKVVMMIVSNPVIETEKIASQLGISVVTVREVLRNLYDEEKSKKVSLFGISNDELREVLKMREENYVKSKLRDTRKRDTEWRGKANWPASVAAKNRRISPIAAAL